MVQRVEIDGEEVFVHDVGAEPGTGWSNVPLGDVGDGTHRKVLVEVKALHPEPGAGWAYNSRTSFLLARPTFVSHLAVGKRTSQSSSLTGYDTGGSAAAVDGNTDGDFKEGSVTSTGQDQNAWWQVDLGRSTGIDSIVVWNRTDCCLSRLSDYWVFVSDDPFDPADTPRSLCHRPRTWNNHQTRDPNPSTRLRTEGTKGRYVRVQLEGKGYLSLAEVQVFGSPDALQ
jgi:hypothetical protein